MTTFVTSKDATRIAYEKIGTGPVVLIVNGALGYRGLGFAKKLRQAMANHFTVIDYDRRGRGESGNTLPFSVKKEVEDIAALVSGPGGGSCHVFAQSSGAALALEAAAAGVPMASLVAYEPPYVSNDPKSQAWRDYPANVTQLVADGKMSEAVAYFMRTVGMPGFVIYIMKLTPMWKQFVAVAHTLPYDAAAMSDFQVPAKRFAGIKVPVTVMAGSKTTNALKLAADEVVKTVPGAKRREAAGMTHAVKPVEIATILAEFIGKSTS